MKKTVCVVCAFIMCLFTCVGCKPNIIQKAPVDFEVNLNIDPSVTETLTLMIPSNDGDAERNYIEALKPGFKKLFPNVTVKYDARPMSDNQYATSVSQAVASGNIPDLFWTNTLYYYYLISKGAVVSLEPYYTASAEAGKLNLEADYYAEFFDMSMYQNRRYIVPRSMDSVVTYYNTEFLAAAGIDPKTDPRLTNNWTWADLISVCRDISDFILSDEGRRAGYDSAYALQAEFDWEAVFNAIMESYGVNIFDSEGNITVNSPELRQMAEDIRALRESGRILRDTTSRSSFTNGKIAFHFSSAGPARQAYNEQIRGKFDALPFPLIGDNPKIGCGFVGYGISSSSSELKRDLAWAFLNYMISEEGQMALINGGLATPSIRVGLAEEKQWSKGYQNLNLDAWLVHEDKKVASNFFMNQSPDYTFDILTSIQTFMKNVSDSSSMSIDRCIEVFVEDLQEAISA